MLFQDAVKPRRSPLSFEPLALTTGAPTDFPLCWSTVSVERLKRIPANRVGGMIRSASAKPFDANGGLGGCWNPPVVKPPSPPGRSGVYVLSLDLESELAKNGPRLTLPLG